MYSITVIKLHYIFITTLNLTSIKIRGYCWSKTKLDGIPVTSWCVAVGIALFFLPSHSPELQPVERLWPLTNEA